MKFARSTRQILLAMFVLALMSGLCTYLSVSIAGNPSYVVVNETFTVNYSGFSAYPVVVVSVVDQNSPASIMRLGSGPTGRLTLQMCCRGNTTATVTVSAYTNPQISASLNPPMTVPLP